MKFWKIKNEANNTPELLLYGPISESTWWGDEVTPKQFIEDMNSLGKINALNVRINSGGGDVFAATAIYSYLKSQNYEVNVYIDGLAASAATIIAMAANKILAPANALFMIHDPAIGLCGMYGTDDLNSMAGTLDTVKDSILEAYICKTKKSKDELSALMSEETWMTGKEACEKGFVDEVLYTEVSASITQKELTIGGNKFDLSNFNSMPNITSSIPKRTEPQKPKQLEGEANNNMTLEEFKNTHKDLYDQIKKEGIEEERNRMKNLDDLGCADKELLNEAKYKNVIDAKELAYNLVKKQAQRAENHMGESNKDAEELDGIEGSSPISDEEKEKNIANMIKKEMEA